MTEELKQKQSNLKHNVSVGLGCTKKNYRENKLFEKMSQMFFFYRENGNQTNTIEKTTLEREIIQLEMGRGKMSQ